MHLKLYHGQTCLGTVEGWDQDGPWVWAKFEPNEHAKKFADFFAFMTDDASMSEPTGFPAEWLDHTQWTLRDDAGRCIKIFVPAVHNDGTIAWRTR